jgi:uncharacterized small protein (DUF1192 family)
VGAAVTAVEETRKLPQTILLYPMTLVSRAANIVMRMQQNVAELIIKGDSLLETLFPPTAEQPEWATFDEDLADELPEPGARVDGERLTEGRFALYSVTDTDARVAKAPTDTTRAKPAKKTAVKAPKKTVAVAAKSVGPAARKSNVAGPAARKSNVAGPAARKSNVAGPAARKSNVAGPAAPVIATELDYEALTLAQLRARLQSLSVGELKELLAYEEATKARAPFQTLLANRILRATAK